MKAQVAVCLGNQGIAARGNNDVARHRQQLITQVIETAGGSVVSSPEAEAIIWLSTGDADELVSVLDDNPAVKWVQLPWAGVEPFVASGLFNRPVTFTCAKGAYGGQVGEHAFMLILASLRHVSLQARTPRWHQIEPEGLEGKRVTVLGAGGITTSLMRYLKAANCDVTVLRRGTDEFAGANRTFQISALHRVLPKTDVLVLALPLTSETGNIISVEELALLPNNAVLVNVARGGHVDTDALVDALENGTIAAAGLDVTSPEPLPSDHPLWQMNNVLITSHCADSLSYITEKLTERVQQNLTRFMNGEQLIGVVDPIAGY